MPTRREQYTKPSNRRGQGGRRSGNCKLPDWRRGLIVMTNAARRRWAPWPGKARWSRSPAPLGSAAVGGASSIGSRRFWRRRRARYNRHQKAAVILQHGAFVAGGYACRAQQHNALDQEQIKRGDEESHPISIRGHGRSDPAEGKNVTTAYCDRDEDARGAHDQRTGPSANFRKRRDEFLVGCRAGSLPQFLRPAIGTFNSVVNSAFRRRSVPPPAATSPFAAKIEERGIGRRASRSRTRAWRRRFPKLVTKVVCPSASCPRLLAECCGIALDVEQGRRRSEGFAERAAALRRKSSRSADIPFARIGRGSRRR